MTWLQQIHIFLMNGTLIRTPIFHQNTFQDTQCTVFGGNVLSTISYKAAISDRASGMGCKVCVKEYKSVLPKLAIMVYAGMKKMSVKFDDDGIIGIPLESYIPEEKLAIETTKPNENVIRLKQYLCKKRNIRLVYISYGRTDEISLLEKIKQAFRSVHIYIYSDTEKDAVIIKQRFYDWRLRQSQSVIAEN